MAAPKKVPLKGTKPQDSRVMEFLPSPKVYPWEDSAQYEALQDAVVTHLVPSTPHEHVLARRIAAAHWEQWRSEQLSQDVFMSACRKAALELLNEQPGVIFPDDKTMRLADDILGSDKALRATALNELAGKGITEEQIRAQAYLEHFQAIEALERRPWRDDERRRALMREYAALKASNQLDHVPDAEIL
ncbi:hypothetical protein [Aliiruegeria lutimaris]|uniref:Uncharacterized protein n=1 Tax=Aliiruegeria lutimaris TaxID=571298 RepID=A0A1G9PGI1_9RHOB|nr:hypothetical protein [Aliiruegeria lutimaris]SDL97317.1 hypothetical protein SAMN04488026_11401 [Aliiruegeria lutimaris]